MFYKLFYFILRTQKRLLLVLEHDRLNRRQRTHTSRGPPGCARVNIKFKACTHLIGACTTFSALTSELLLHRHQSSVRKAVVKYSVLGHLRPATRGCFAHVNVIAHGATSASAASQTACSPQQIGREFPAACHQPCCRWRQTQQ